MSTSQLDQLQNDPVIRAQLERFDRDVTGWFNSPSIRGVDQVSEQLSFWNATTATFDAETAAPPYRYDASSSLAVLAMIRAAQYARFCFSTPGISPEGPASLPFLIMSHALAMEEVVPPALVGSFRNSAAVIYPRDDGSHSYPVPPPEDLNKHLSQWSNTYKAANCFTHHPILRAAMAHLDLVKIHPFSAGTDRVARIAVSAMLVEDAQPALPMTQAFSLSPDEYKDARANAILTGDPTQWATYYIKSANESMRLLRADVVEVQKIVHDYDTALKPIITDDRQRRATSTYIAGSPIFHPTLLARRVGLDDAVLEKTVSTLLNRGMLVTADQTPNRMMSPAAFNIVRKYNTNNTGRPPGPATRNDSSKKSHLSLVR